MSVKLLLARIHQDELAARGADVLAPTDYEQIVERLVEQINDIELSLSAQKVTGRPESE
ncbi:hypothetical protein [Bradyrhizobium sp. BR 1432]|uniref:hypothetical protein n=1 Tax=Bradyrhizobium sp. BR 1432 TaxID=3447966 RepID=UPI003EE6FFC3